MSLLWIVLPSAVILLTAYFTYGRLLSRLLKLDPKARTPAVELRDDVDYSPIEPRFLLSQHFSAIAAAGPIVGPILAGVYFGWLPALIWILLGSIFIGGVHDMTALVASIRHKARSIAEVVRDHMSRRAYVLFLAFVWLALVYIIVAFTDVTSSSFVGLMELENGDRVLGPGIFTSSLLYLLIPVIMGLMLRYTKISLLWATVIFLPLVGLSIWVGQFIPLDLANWFNLTNKEVQKLLNVGLLIYCFVASIVPMWLLLQPRGHLGGVFLYFVLIGGALGLLLGGKTIEYPAFIGWESVAGGPLLPMLFITIACGACSGFHSIIASGTTSKQLRSEPDARVIGYGSMLLEAMVAIVSLCCVMMLAQNSPLLAKGPQPNFLYAQGIGRFLEALNIPAAFGVSFGLMAFTTFVYDTLDVCTRLGRYILQELFGWQSKGGRWLATAITAGVPLYFLVTEPANADGKPLYTVFWGLFGASNQLLASLTLLGVTVWLWRTRRAWWVLLVTGLPTVLMYVMSSWALLRIIAGSVGSDLLLTRLLRIEPTVAADKLSVNPVLWVAIVLVGLAVLVLVEAIRSFVGGAKLPPQEPRGVPAGA